MTRRQQRYKTLREAHFMPSEARTLSKISFAVPYMKPLIKDRAKKYDRFVSEGGTEKEWLKAIKKDYTDNGWRKAGEGWTSKVIFRMLKAKEKDWKYKHPEYESPWEKRQGRQRTSEEISAKIDRTAEKYPKGRTYAKRQPQRRIEYLPGGGARFVD